MLTRSFLISAFFIVSILIVHASWGQKDSTLSRPQKFYARHLPFLKFNPKKADSTYVKTDDEHLSLSTYYMLYNVSLNMTSKTTLDHSGKNISSNFQTNTQNIFGLSVGYRSLGAGFSFNVPGNSTPGLAPTNYRTFDLEFTGTRSSVFFNYFNVKGFTDHNKDNSTPLYQPYLQRSDIQVINYQLDYLFNFNWKKYSYAAAVSLSERQLKSYFGFLLKAGAAYNNINADSALLSPVQKTYYGDFANIKSLQGYSFKLAPGIGGNLILFKRFYFSGIFFPGYDLFLYRYLNNGSDKTTNGQSFILVLDGSLSIGYQSEHFFIGIRELIDNKGTALHDVNINVFTSYTVFEVGYHFKAPKFLQKSYQNIMPRGL